MLNWFKKKEILEPAPAQIEGRRVSLTIYYFNENIKTGGCSRFGISKICKNEEELEKCAEEYKKLNLEFAAKMQSGPNYLIDFLGLFVFHKKDFIKSEIIVN